jgi:streptomycin 6-kinase
MNHLKLKNQVISAFGEKGLDWLNRLPDTIQECASKWNLKDIVPFENLSWNFVGKGKQDQLPVVLKISCDLPSLRREVTALRVFPPGSCIGALELEESLGAVLLEAAEPGEELRSQTRDPLEILAICCDLARRLQRSQNASNYPFETVQDLLANLDKNWPQIPKEMISVAHRLKNELVVKTPATHIIHGDLHRQNILSHENDWRAIDPKGFVGNLYNEVWPFIENPQDEIPFAAKTLQLNEELLYKWCFVHAILAASWCLEDGIDPKGPLELGRRILPHL